MVVLPDLDEPVDAAHALGKTGLILVDLPLCLFKPHEVAFGDQRPQAVFLFRLR